MWPFSQLRKSTDKAAPAPGTAGRQGPLPHAPAIDAAIDATTGGGFAEQASVLTSPGAMPRHDAGQSGPFSSRAGGDNTTAVPPDHASGASEASGSTPFATSPFASTGPQGHRGRMREKLLERGSDALADYELLEMLLFFAMPKGDTKPLAKALINRFGSFANVLAAPQATLLQTRGLGVHSVSAIILVHNHPSGDPTPSRSDIEMTRMVKEAATALSVTLHDHLIIGNGRWLSFRAEGLL